MTKRLVTGKENFSYTVNWFVLISGTGLILASRFDSESWFGFGYDTW